MQKIIFIQSDAGCWNWYFYELMFSVISCNIYPVLTVGTNDNNPKVLVCLELEDYGERGVGSSCCTKINLQIMAMEYRAIAIQFLLVMMFLAEFRGGLSMMVVISIANAKCQSMSKSLVVGIPFVKVCPPNRCCCSLKRIKI